MKYVPRPYQIEGARFLRDRKYALLGDACGVGKTGQAIMALPKISGNILIVCPASVKNQWRQAFIDWRNWSAQVIESSKWRLDSWGSSIHIVNYDLLIRESIFRQLLTQRWLCIIFDEAHKLKSLTAKRTKAALSQKGLFSRTDRIWFLTGTPVKNRTIDLYPILRSCAPEVLGSYKSFLKFAYRYCGAYTGRFGLDTSGASHTEELCERLKGFMLRREKRDVLTQLPPRVISKVDLECTPAVKKIIELEEVATIEKAGDNDPANFKLGEIARIRKAIAKYKVPISVEYIKDLLEEEDKIVVFYYHKEVLGELRRAFKEVPHVFVDGSVAPHRRKGLVAEFADRKDCRVFFGQMEACGEGIDGLQTACSCCVFVEPSWSHTDLEQCIGRLERSGQRSDINVHILTIKDTLEARMMEVVAMKLNVDKKLYNQTKEKTMAKQEVENPMDKIAAALKQIGESLVIVADAIGTLETPAAKPAPVAVKDPVPVEVEPQEEEVTEDAIRARAADICALKDKGGKEKVIELVKKIGGGKIADLKTPAMRQKCMAALDKLYNQLAG